MTPSHHAPPPGAKATDALNEAWRGARELLIVLPVSGVQPVLPLLTRPLASRPSMVVLCAWARDIEALRDLLHAGTEVYAISTCPERAVVCVDRRVCWNFPDITPLPDPTVVVAAFLQERHADFSLISGTVETESGIRGCFRFAGRPHVYCEATDAPGQILCQPGARITVLARRSFWQSRMPYFVDVLGVWPLERASSGEDSLTGVHSGGGGVR